MDNTAPISRRRSYVLQWTKGAPYTIGLLASGVNVKWLKALIVDMGYGSEVSNLQLGDKQKIVIGIILAIHSRELIKNEKNLRFIHSFNPI